MGRLSPDQRHQALRRLSEGVSARKVAEEYGCSHTAIRKLQAKYQETGTVKDLRRRAPKRKTTQAEDRMLDR